MSTGGPAARAQQHPPATRWPSPPASASPRSRPGSPGPSAALPDSDTGRGAARGGCGATSAQRRAWRSGSPRSPNSTCGTAPAAPELRTEGGQGRPRLGDPTRSPRGEAGGGNSGPALGLPRLLAQTPWVHDPRAPLHVRYLGVERPGGGSRGRLPARPHVDKPGPALGQERAGLRERDCGRSGAGAEAWGAGPRRVRRGRPASPQRPSRPPGADRNRKRGAASRPTPGHLP